MLAALIALTSVVAIYILSPRPHHTNRAMSTQHTIEYSGSLLFRELPTIRYPELASAWAQEGYGCEPMDTPEMLLAAFRGENAILLESVVALDVRNRRTRLRLAKCKCDLLFREFRLLHDKSPASQGAKFARNLHFSALRFCGGRSPPVIASLST
ncbi:hypothetical protein GCM10007907_26980 [Chitinimonas prasina]|uniref:DUF2726 domain-containing protein n=1 Tax=Chitinimonas prasina TaxID=1434937 RepID=A0ABQ5YIV0_9NEIS|nr:hypothetical protein GCM10007907_26980 [Chitinimonas prasina]